MAALPLRGLLGLTALIVLSTVLLSCEYASAARGGGSSRSGGRSNYRRSSSSRSRSSSITVRTKVKISMANVRYGNRYYLIPSTVHIYGYSHYKTRHLYVTNHNDDPTVCYNDEEVDNGTAIGYFICPMADDPDSATYCCGDDDEQYCCNFWADTGRITGAVTGIFTPLIVIIIAILLLKNCCRSVKATKSTRRKVTVTSGKTACLIGRVTKATKSTHRKDTVTSGAKWESVPLAYLPPVSLIENYAYADLEQACGEEDSSVDPLPAIINRTQLTSSEV